MKSCNLKLKASLAILTSLAWGAPSAMAQHYELVDLGEGAIPQSINQAGDVAGLLIENDDREAFRMINGRLLRIAKPAGTSAESAAINDRGEVALSLKSAAGLAYVTLVRGKTSKDMGQLGLQNPSSIQITYFDNAGIVAGSAKSEPDQKQRGFVTKSSMQNAVTDDFYGSFAKLRDWEPAINRGVGILGHMAGSEALNFAGAFEIYQIDENNTVLSTEYQSGGWGDPAVSELNAINSNYLSVGKGLADTDGDGLMTSHGILKLLAADYGALDTESLPPLGGFASTDILDINSNNEIVGYSGANSDDIYSQLATLHSDITIEIGGLGIPELQISGDWIDLNSKIGPHSGGWILHQATKINDRGDIIGIGSLPAKIGAGRELHGFLLKARP